MFRFLGLTWVDSKGTRQKTKFNWSKGELQRLVGPAAAVALQKAGLEVRKATQRSMVGGATPTGRQLRAKPVWWKVGEKDGYPVVAYVKKVPRPDKVSSWAPKAFLRNDVQSDWDPRTRSVVIGPSKFPWLNKLHEFGGSVNVYVSHGKYPAKTFAGENIPKRLQRESTYRVSNGKRSRTVKRRDGAYVGVFNNNGGAFRVGTRQVKGRRYMEIGLLRSINKIPQQFRNTMGYGTIRVHGEGNKRR